MSAAGGFERAVERAAAETCDVVQLFVASPRQWVGPKSGSTRSGPGPSERTEETDGPATSNPLSDEQVTRFQAALESLQIRAPLSHSSYLINLASPDANLWKKSLESLIVELRRADQLGIVGVVLHPGSYTTSSEEAGLRRVAEALAEVERQTSDANVLCLLETTAGQGTNLGARFEHLATLLDRLQNPRRFAVCLDTCHLFAAGYPLHPRKEYLRTMRQLEQTVGITAVRAIHLNDSKHPLGSRKDRHEHIGRGEMGLEPFRYLLNDRRLRRVPMYLETPKGMHGKQSWDRLNLRRLRQLVEV